MATLTLGTDIRTDVETRLAQSFSTNTNTTTTQVNSMIFEASRKLAAYIRSQEFGDDFFTQTDAVTLNGTHGTIDITDDLTSTFYRIKKIAWLKGASTTPTPIPRASIDDTYLGGIETGSWGGAGPVYRIVKNEIVFYPAPSETVTVLVTYDTDIGLESDLSNTVVLYPGWREWIVLDTCRLVAQREKDMQLSAQFAAERDEIGESIVKLSVGRDEWMPESVRDVLGLNDGVTSYNDSRWRGR